MGDLHDVIEAGRAGPRRWQRQSCPAGRETAGAVGALAAGERQVPSQCAEAEAGEIGASGEEDQGGDARPPGASSRRSAVERRGHTHQARKAERESTEEPPTVRTLADTAPRCRRPATTTAGRTATVSIKRHFRDRNHSEDPRGSRVRTSAAAPWQPMRAGGICNGDANLHHQILQGRSSVADRGVVVGQVLLQPTLLRVDLSRRRLLWPAR